MNIEWDVAERFRLRFLAIATAALLPVVAAWRARMTSPR